MNFRDRGGEREGGWGAGGAQVGRRDGAGAQGHLRRGALQHLREAAAQARRQQVLLRGHLLQPQGGKLDQFSQNTFWINHQIRKNVGFTRLNFILGAWMLP